MKITGRHKMKDLPKLSILLNHSKVSLLEQVAEFPIPDYIEKYTVIPTNDICIEDMIMFWNAKTDVDMYKYTAKALLRVTEDKILNFPLIDFLRITLLMGEIAKEAANAFMSLQRESNNPKIKEIANSYANSDFSIIDRFVKRTPSYTHEEAAQVSWRIYYECFKLDTMDYDINEVVSEDAIKNINKKK